jgi:dextranase
MRYRKIECYPNAAQYKENQSVLIIINTKEDLSDDAKLLLRVTNLEKTIVSREINISGAAKDEWIEIGQFHNGGYGVDLIENEIVVARTAFDVVAKGQQVIRYGFLTDFDTNEKSDEDILFMNKMHLNAVQFYDWMYRHEELVSDNETYKNPLDLEVSNEVIKRKIEQCKHYQIRPFAYGAVYAASKQFYESHKDWAMYTKDGKVISFADWLIFMNISKECAWSKYIVEQFKEAIKCLGFEGIHMDTYGYPKKAWSHDGKKIELDQDFSFLINQAANAVREENPNAGVIFNAVNDWPIEKVAAADQDSLYIEVWPPHDTYYDLYHLIKKARTISDKKNVILAAYMHPFAEENYDANAEKAFLLTYAVICASGGSQLVLGESGGALCDSYYNKYATLSKLFLTQVQVYANYVVEYRELLMDSEIVDISLTAAGGINEDLKFQSKKCCFSSKAEADKVWTLVGITNHRMILHLINLCGENDLWNEAKKSDKIEIDDIVIQILLDRKIKGIYFASPDFNDGRKTALSYRCEIGEQGNYLYLSDIRLQIWSTVWIDYE